MDLADKLRRQLAARKRKILRRLDKTKFPKHCGPVLHGGNLTYESADRVHAIGHGIKADQLPVNPDLFWTDGGANSLVPARR